MSVNQPYNEKELIVRIISGDGQAFSALFEKYYNRIYGKTLQLVKIPAIAEDVTQQVFLKVWERRAHLAAVEHPAAWLFQVARNLIADRFREQLMEERYLRYALELLDARASSPEDILLQRQRRELLQRSLEGLSPKQKEVYRLSREEGKSYQEIAGLLGISRETVKEYMQIALAKIRQYLIEHKEELISLVLLSGMI